MSRQMLLLGPGVIRIFLTGGATSESRLESRVAGAGVAARITSSFLKNTRDNSSLQKNYTIEILFYGIKQEVWKY